MNNISVNIFGNEYSIAGDAESSEIEKYAKYLDTKLAELSANTDIDSKYKLAILCGLNIIEEMFEKREKIDNIEKRLEKVSRLLDSYVD
ncbi:MAG: cell division protein ZapA [Candidatus Cloacimonetes bacterium]|nr:cell division protein ZapA [Candidatus Cloacimonadota bacterium]MBL7108307.1 cell division protein ZapA [Candidatus Cloacimonadota bacterium]